MSEVEDMLSDIKRCWPELVISKENLLQPTPEVVFQFYSNFINDYNEKIAQLTRSPPIFNFNSADYEQEELLVLELSKLLGKISGLKLTIADIYEPKPRSTRSFFKVCIHFIRYLECQLTEAETLGNEVYTTQENTTKLLLEQHELIDEINEIAKNKAELSENKNLLEQELKSTKTAYEKMKMLKATKEKLYAEKRKQIENLKRELQNEEYELKCLEDEENNLLKQLVTEREYQNIQKTIETLKSELEMLYNNNINIDDGLVEENKVLQHNADCIRMLNKCEFDVKIVEKLIHKEDEFKVISNTADKLTAIKLNPAKQQKFENEQKLASLKEKLINLQSEHKVLKHSYTTTIAQFSQELSDMKNSRQNESNRNCKIIADYERDIGKLEEDFEKMKKTFTIEYIKVSKIEKVVIDKFKEVLVKFKDME
ncbi:myosin-11 [Anoplophora glabripennis]|uniref:myosin-11 n=1 Tax=Anoplophora glabripennis TaxID=217634 RepID=UPI0008743B75|nr:myosin-11 [Anoplophora glabripennis]